MGLRWNSFLQEDHNLPKYLTRAVKTNPVALELMNQKTGLFLLPGNILYFCGLSSELSLRGGTPSFYLPVLLAQRCGIPYAKNRTTSVVRVVKMPCFGFSAITRHWVFNISMILSEKKTTSDDGKMNGNLQGISILLPQKSHSIFSISDKHMFYLTGFHCPCVLLWLHNINDPKPWCLEAQYMCINIMC